VYGVPVGTYANKQSPLGVSVGEYHFELQCTWCIRRGRIGVSGVAVVAYDFELRAMMYVYVIVCVCHSIVCVCRRLGAESDNVAAYERQVT